MRQPCASRAFAVRFACSVCCVLLTTHVSACEPQVPAEAMKTIEEELAKLSTLEPSSSEFNVTAAHSEPNPTAA